MAADGLCLDLIGAAGVGCQGAFDEGAQLLVKAFGHQGRGGLQGETVTLTADEQGPAQIGIKGGLAHLAA